MNPLFSLFERDYDWITPACTFAGGDWRAVGSASVLAGYVVHRTAPTLGRG